MTRSFNSAQLVVSGLKAIHASSFGICSFHDPRHVTGPLKVAASVATSTIKRVSCTVMKTRFGIEKGTPFKEIFRVTSVMLGNWGGGSGAECG